MQGLSKKIWDLETKSCLLTASSKASGTRGQPGACLYLPGPRALCVATDTVALLHLRLRSPLEPHPVVSHKEPVVCCQYNPPFSGDDRGHHSPDTSSSCARSLELHSQ
ncbi:hypothetical protein J1605_007206 [Eschrichtius robustus]|uniref:Uncharacterized protein n=1 Tax=Eschrichtius robustus TaxID=9764 RepID=A0AB34H1U0_ESCRO|nr:hypothetical protein J1605_007206 [Eschrichtius robustus]